MVLASARQRSRNSAHREMFLIYESLILFVYPTTGTCYDALVGANRRLLECHLFNGNVNRISLNTFMEFQKLVEDVMSGGEGSAFGPAANEPYGEHSDPRTPFVMGGVMTRSGMRKNKRSKKRKKRKQSK